MLITSSGTGIVSCSVIPGSSRGGKSRKFTSVIAGCAPLSRSSSKNRFTNGGFPDSVRVQDGHIVMPDLPGIGFEGKSDLIKVMRELAE